jgi:hypothetical protein
MAATIETPVRRRIKLQRRLFLVPISALAALHPLVIRTAG